MRMVYDNTEGHLLDWRICAVWGGGPSSFTTPLVRFSCAAVLLISNTIRMFNGAVERGLPGQRARAVFGSGCIMWMTLLCGSFPFVAVHHVCHDCQARGYVSFRLPSHVSAKCNHCLFSQLLCKQGAPCSK